MTEVFTFEDVVLKSGLPPATIQRLILRGSLKIAAEGVYALLAVISESESEILRKTEEVHIG